ncbi:MAG TPA: hemerythrin domain-containing protein [Myxococcota bacterium]|nr:hemerythrin domain-containing protein [Myxococcota bacterium]
MSDALETGLRHRLRRAVRRSESQHTQLRALLAEIEAPLRAGTRVVAADLVARLREALQAHFALEDQTLFPALHGLRPDVSAPIEGLAREHADFLAALAGALGTASGCDGDAFLRLRAALGDHERREEQLLESIVGVDGPRGL